MQGEVSGHCIQLPNWSIGANHLCLCVSCPDLTLRLNPWAYTSAVIRQQQHKICLFVLTEMTSLVPRPFVGQTAWELPCNDIQKRHGDYSCTHTSHPYWIVHVIFECSRVTARDMQVHFFVVVFCQQDSLQACIVWLLSYLSSVDAPLAVDSLLLTDVDMPD